MKKSLQVGQKTYEIFDINHSPNKHEISIEELPFSIRVLVENIIRNGANDQECTIISKKYNNNQDCESAINFFPARVLMQDFTGVPAVVDIAAIIYIACSTQKNIHYFISF